MMDKYVEAQIFRVYFCFDLKKGTYMLTYNYTSANEYKTCFQ